MKPDIIFPFFVSFFSVQGAPNDLSSNILRVHISRPLGFWNCGLKVNLSPFTKKNDALDGCRSVSFKWMDWIGWH